MWHRHYNNLSIIVAFLVSLLPHLGQQGRFGPNLMPPSVSKASNLCPHCLHLNVAFPLKCSIFIVVLGSISKGADFAPIFCNGGPEKTLKVEYDRNPRLYNAETTVRHSPPSYFVLAEDVEFLRFPFGENEARCFAFSMSMISDKSDSTAKIYNLFELTMLLSKFYSSVIIPPYLTPYLIIVNPSCVIRSTAEHR